MSPRTAEPEALGNAVGEASWARSTTNRGQRAGIGRRLGLGPRDADLIVLAGLLAITAAGGRAFSQLGMADTVFVSEVALLAAIVLALVRLGLPAAWHRLRDEIPLLPLAVIWLLGAIATVRGLNEFGLSLVTEDIGLAEYSVLLPLVALVVSDRRRLELLGQALLIGSVACLALFLIQSIAVRLEGTGPIELMGSASGMYISLFVAWIGARAFGGVDVPRWEIVLAALGLLLMWFTDQRSVWLALILTAVALVALAPRARRIRAAAYTGCALVASCALYLALAEAFPVPAGTATATGDDADSPQSQPLREFRGLAGGSTEEGANVTWRVAYWKELTERTATDPSVALIGVGFGRPAEFVWQGAKYDFRDGDPTAQMDVGGPHNSFVAIMYRMGVFALVAVLALLVIAFRRAAPLLREGHLPAGRRAELIAIVCAVLLTTTIAALNEALKGPFLGMFFWVALALLLVYPSIEREGATGRRSRDERTRSVAVS